MPPPEPASAWDQWVARDPMRFCQIFLKNRAFLARIPRWLSPDVYASALSRYGLPHGPQALQVIYNHLTYTDFLAFVSGFLPTPITYLEIGVSAGKNFLPLCHQLRGATLVGLDIEAINPVLESYFEQKDRIWEADAARPFQGPLGMRRKRATLTRYHFAPHDNTIYYLSGDKFDPDVWAQLAGHRFNLVFSDARHHPDSIRSECDFLLAQHLLAKDACIILWDDLGGGMTAAFEEVVAVYGQHFGPEAPWAARYEMHGTYGGDPQRNGLHQVGAFFHLPNLKPLA